MSDDAYRSLATVIDGTVASIYICEACASASASTIDSETPRRAARTLTSGEDYPVLLVDVDENDRVIAVQVVERDGELLRLRRAMDNEIHQPPTVHTEAPAAGSEHAEG